MNDPDRTGKYYVRADGETVHECDFCGRWRADAWRTQLVFPGSPDETRRVAMDWIICFACKGQVIHALREVAKIRRRGEQIRRWQAALASGKTVDPPSATKGPRNER